MSVGREGGKERGREGEREKMKKDRSYSFGFAHRDYDV